MSMPAQQLEPLWTVADVACYLAKSKSWVAHNRHLLPEPSRIGSELRWTPDEIRAWAAAQREGRVVPLKPGR